MVSRLVDAKPDEMRVYIEEAAGISRYKERRRETESRIQHTRDNLARLNDVREEITKQLDSLQRQAKAAERYKELRSRERRLEAELLAMRLRDIDNSLTQSRADLARRETSLESAIADQRRIEAEIVALREQHTAATDAFNAIQAKHYAAQSEISRLEQELAHHRQIGERQQADLKETGEQQQEVSDEIEGERSRLEELDSALAQLEPELARARAAEAEAAEALHQAEVALEQWQDRWQEFNLGLKELQQATQVEKTRSEHLLEQLSQLSRQRDALERDRNQLGLDHSSIRLDSQRDIESRTQEKVDQLAARLAEVDGEIESSRSLERRLSVELEQATTDLAAARGRLETLQAVQELALGAEDEALGAWLEREQLRSQPRLAQQLRVEERWILAVETVLGDFLQAVCVPGFAHHLSALPDTQVALLEPETADTEVRPESLLSRVAEPRYAVSLLADVLIAGDVDEAVRLQSRLGPRQSVVTPDGIWLGPGWVRINRGQRNAAGLLAREGQIRDLRESVSVLMERVTLGEQQRVGARQHLLELAASRVDLTEKFNLANREHAEAVAVLENLQQEVRRSQERQVALDGDIAQVAEEISRVSTILSEARNRAETADRDRELLAEARPDLQREQQERLSAYNTARELAEQARSAVGRLNVEFESKKVGRDSIGSGMARLDMQLEQLGVRARQLEQDLESGRKVQEDLHSQLLVQLERQVEIDRDLAGKRHELEQVESDLRASEGRRHDAEQAVGIARENTEQVRMQTRETEVRRESVVEAFAATGSDIHAVTSELPADADPAEWQASIEKARRSIERLGPINLAAIEQFDEQSERKKYLDAQNEDLIAALDTLEQAIRKIDRETRSRFQETFDNINQGLKRIFPRLFGGGHAYLSLEGEDILSAGVTVMARPPGKRNSHIHLLSGGEKALTAVALIFSIFELNPAPFCLLDEVDAPLDEANVGRFCEIVAEMSQRVQFVVITHNKTSMEMMKQLTGVTMNEPGVSRLVSVDLDTAVQMAAS
ncbi:MAG: chromosome segregation protein SMC [Gammaproteobacteria bacterium]|nr:chromosome segregation protein SMC [Gammaproteobacteria bacterium]